MQNFTIFGGSANHGLADAIANTLGVRLGACTCARHPDGEVAVELGESVRRKDVFIVQPTAPPVDPNLMELLAIADACRRSAAAHVTAIVPYFGYARSDKRKQHEPIMASLVADLMQAAGINHVITVDLHATQIEGFFRIPVDNLTAVPQLVTAVREHLRPNTVVVSPDAGRVKMAGEYAQALGTSVAVLHKQRQSGTSTHVTHLVGEVRDRPCLIIDDMIATGGTLADGIAMLLQAGARPDMSIAATHGVLIPGSHDRLSDPSIHAVFVTDSVATQTDAWAGLRVVSLAPLIAEAIRHTYGNENAGFVV
jgi:ribose-phosphate pyrophosphokinase